MANLARFNVADDVLEDLFRGFLARPVRAEGAPAVQARMDVKEDDSSYVVSAEIPGVKKEDIHVTIDGNQVAISAEVRSAQDVKEGEKVLRSERRYGRVARAFTLAQEVDEAAAEAKYEDGVLRLTLPKKAVTKARRLEIA